MTTELYVKMRGTLQGWQRTLPSVPLLAARVADWQTALAYDTSAKAFQASKALARAWDARDDPPSALVHVKRAVKALDPGRATFVPAYRRSSIKALRRLPGGGYPAKVGPGFGVDVKRLANELYQGLDKVYSVLDNAKKDAQRGRANPKLLRGASNILARLERQRWAKPLGLSQRQSPESHFRVIKNKLAEAWQHADDPGEIKEFEYIVTSARDWTYQLMQYIKPLR